MTEVGEITVREIHVPVCLECGCVIGETGLCDESCKYDGDAERLPETVECHVYKRTDEYIRKEPFHAGDPPKGEAKDLIAELKRRIKFLKAMIPCEKHCKGGHPAISGKLSAYRNILRLIRAGDPPKGR